MNITILSLALLSLGKEEKCKSGVDGDCEGAQGGEAGNWIVESGLSTMEVNI